MIDNIKHIRECYFFSLSHGPRLKADGPDSAYVQFLTAKPFLD